MTTEVHVSYDTYVAHRELLDAWVTDHGLELTRVPIPTVFRFHGDHFDVELYRLNEDGQKYLDRGEPAKDMVAVPLVRPWPLSAEAKP